MIDNKKINTKKAQTGSHGAPPQISAEGSPGNHSIYRNVSADGTNSIHRKTSETSTPTTRTGSKLKKK